MTVTARRIHQRLALCSDHGGIEPAGVMALEVLSVCSSMPGVGMTKGSSLGSTVGTALVLQVTLTHRLVLQYRRFLRRDQYQTVHHTPGNRKVASPFSRPLRICALPDLDEIGYVTAHRCGCLRCSGNGASDESLHRLPDTLTERTLPFPGLVTPLPSRRCR